jgi:hypothetical protein
MELAGHVNPARIWKRLVRLSFESGCGHRPKVEFDSQGKLKALGDLRLVSLREILGCLLRAVWYGVESNTEIIAGRGSSVEPE